MSSEEFLFRRENKQSLELPDFVILKSIRSELNVYLNLADYT